MKKTFLLMTCLALVFIISSRSLCAVEREFNEYEVKAAFLVNFFKFVEWPTRGGDGAATYNLCIYGSDPFGQHAKMINGAKVRGRTLKVKKVVSSVGLKECNILFVSSSERRRVSMLLDAIRGMDLLTVGDTEGYAQNGIMVNFFIVGKNVRFEINLNAIKSTRINVSSQLLKLGRIVDNE